MLGSVVVGLLDLPSSALRCIPRLLLGKGVIAAGHFLCMHLVAHVRIPAGLTLPSCILWEMSNTAEGQVIKAITAGSAGKSQPKLQQTCHNGPKRSSRFPCSSSFLRSPSLRAYIYPRSTARHYHKPQLLRSCTSYLRRHLPHCVILSFCERLPFPTFKVSP